MPILLLSTLAHWERCKASERSGVQLYLDQSAAFASVCRQLGFKEDMSDERVMTLVFWTLPSTQLSRSLSTRSLSPLWSRYVSTGMHSSHLRPLTNSHGALFRGALCQALPPVGLKQGTPLETQCTT